MTSSADPRDATADAQSAGRRGVVAVIACGGRWLVIRRSQQVQAPGAYCFPGGGIEEGEDEPQALRRELREELGCEVVGLQRLWQSVTAWRVSLAWWRAELGPATVLEPNASEVESVHWLTPAEIRLLPELLSSNHDFLDAWEAGRFHLRG